jgi:hypothetical protein
MQDSALKKILSVLYFIVIMFSTEYKAQTDDTLYNVYANIGVGFTRYVTALPQLGLDKNSLNITGRIMWKPEHLLSVGFESGYVPLYFLRANNYNSVFGTTDVDLSMIAIPIFLTFGMEVFDDFIIYGGVGGASLNSTADYFENRVVNASWTNAYELAASYSFYGTKNLELSGEFKWYNFSKVEDSALILQIAIMYNLLSY